MSAERAGTASTDAVVLKPPEGAAKPVPGTGIGTEAPHVSWYLDEGRRYAIGKWPKNLAWFDRSNSVKEIVEFPPGITFPMVSPPCAPGRCPSTGAAQPTPGTPSPSGSVATAMPDAVPRS